MYSKHTGHGRTIYHTKYPPLFIIMGVSDQNSTPTRNDTTDWLTDWVIGYSNQWKAVMHLYQISNIKCQHRDGEVRRMPLSRFYVTTEGLEIIKSSFSLSCAVSLSVKTKCIPLLLLRGRKIPVTQGMLIRLSRDHYVSAWMDCDQRASSSSSSSSSSSMSPQWKK